MRARHASASSTGLTVPERTASEAARRPSATRSVDGIEDLRDDLEASERGHQVGAGVALAHGPAELLRHLDAGAERAVDRLAQATSDRLGDRDAGDLVVEELGVARAVERENADQHRNRRAPGPPEKALALGQVLHGLSLHPARARLHFPVETVDLAGDVLGRRIQGSAHVERGRLADAAPGRVLTLVHPAKDLDQTDAVDVED